MDTEYDMGRARMQTATNISLVLTDSTSFMRSSDSKKELSHAEFYQQLARKLIRSGSRRQLLDTLGDTLVRLAHSAYTFRRMEAVEQAGRLLASLPISVQRRSIGWFYQALSLKRKGATDECRLLLEGIADQVPQHYKGRVILSLAGLDFESGKYESATRLYCDASRAASSTGCFDLFTLAEAHRQIAVLGGIIGSHSRAATQLESFYAPARMARSQDPYLWYAYLNSLAVELCEVGRLEEARNVSRIVVASSYASAYSEWRETLDDIDLKSYRLSRSTVPVTRAATATKSTATNAYNSVESGKLLVLPTVNRSADQTASSRDSQSLARIIKFAPRTSMLEENDEDLDIAEKRKFVADRLYEMFMDTLQDKPVDFQLINRLYKVYLETKKKNS